MAEKMEQISARKCRKWRDIVVTFSSTRSEENLSMSLSIRSQFDIIRKYRPVYAAFIDMYEKL